MSLDTKPHDAQPLSSAMRLFTDVARNFLTSPPHLFKAVSQGAANVVQLAVLRAMVLGCGLIGCSKPLPAPPAAVNAPPVQSVNNIPSLAKAPFNGREAKAHQEAWAKYLGISVETIDSVGAKMILIPPGEFQMGTGSSKEETEVLRKIFDDPNATDAARDSWLAQERPSHRVVITKPFLIGMTEVTVGQFKKFVEASSYQTEAEKVKEMRTYLNPGHPMTDDSPASSISWNDAVAYCNWLSGREKATYRLPTEAEWEYACRAGTTTQYSFGDDVELLKQYGWYAKSSDGGSQWAGKKLPNAFGLHDMHGNLFEWCQDYYSSTWYAQTPSDDPSGPSSESNRVIRGGNWRSTAYFCRSAFRLFSSQADRGPTRGFRCVRESQSGG
jgi:formylglycine-generating enzyme required for sulfatase activity